jgi:hypothetical protein
MPERSQRGGTPPLIASLQLSPPLSGQTSGFDISSLPGDLQTSVSHAWNEIPPPSYLWVCDEYVHLDPETQKSFSTIGKALSMETVFSACANLFQGVDEGLLKALSDVCTAIVARYFLDWTADALLAAVGEVRRA